MTGVCAIRHVAIAIVLACVACNARAEDQYPTRSMTMVVPFAAGGPTDILGRILAQFMSQSLGQQVIVEDTTGAGGTIGRTGSRERRPTVTPW